jgi:hypothetical protein
MSRKFSRIIRSIWKDNDFRGLTPEAQHLYFVLISDPKLTYAGVTDWRPEKISGRANGWTADQVAQAGHELANALFIVIDDDTEEVLIRTFHRNDECLSVPNMSRAVIDAYETVESPTISGVIIHELTRLHEQQPSLPGWNNIGTFLNDYHAIDPGTLTPEPAGAPF